MKSPCEECLMIPICRHKMYTPLMEECSTLATKLYKHKMPDIRYRRRIFYEIMPEIYSTLKPTKWRIQRNGKSFNIIGLPP